MFGELKTDEAEITILGGAGVQIPPCTEMRPASVSKVRQTRNGEEELEVFQDLAILSYIAVNNAKGRILKNGGVLCLHGQSVSQMEETIEIREFCRAFSGNGPKSANEKEIADINELQGEWKECMEEWNIEEKIPKGPIGGAFFARWVITYSERRK